MKFFFKTEGFDLIHSDKMTYFNQLIKDNTIIRLGYIDYKKI